MSTKPHHALHKKEHTPLINKLILVVAFLQPLSNVPQIITLYTLRDASGISLLSWLIFIAFDFLWLWYGIVNKQTAVILSAVLFAALESVVAIGAYIYGAPLL